MKTKTRLFTLSVLAVLIAALALPSTANAAVLTVNPAGGATYTTIAAAVGAALPYDTIQCAAGIYPIAGNTGITLSKPVTLLGAQAGVDARTRGPNGIAGAETVMPTSTNIFGLYAVDITIDGFYFQNMGPRGFDTYGNPDNLTVRNCIFKSTTGNSSGGNIQFGGGGSPLYHANNFLFERNYVQNGGGGNMLYMGHVMDNGTIRDNYINGDNFAFGPFGTRTGWLIEGNEFDGNVPGHGPYWGFGFNANLGDVIIRDNYVHEMVVGIGQISVVDGSITGNTFNDNSYAAFQLWGGEWGSVVSTNATIQNNAFSYNGTACTGFGDASHAIRLRPAEGAVGPIDSSTIHIQYNSFTDLGVGTCGQAWAIRNNGANAADAVMNWWNTTDPALIATKFGQGAVNFTPWITSYIDDPAKAGKPGFWPINVVDSSFMPQFMIDEAKIDWKKKLVDDKIMVKGVFNLPEGADPAKTVTLFVNGIQFGPIPMDPKDNGKKWEYKRPKGTTGIKDMKIDWKKKEAKFEIHIDDAVIPAWTNPNVSITLQIGVYKGSKTILMKMHNDKWEYHK